MADPSFVTADESTLRPINGYAILALKPIPTAVLLTRPTGMPSSAHPVLKAMLGATWKPERLTAHLRAPRSDTGVDRSLLLRLTPAELLLARQAATYDATRTNQFNRYAPLALDLLIGAALTVEVLEGRASTGNATGKNSNGYDKRLLGATRQDAYVLRETCPDLAEASVSGLLASCMLEGARWQARHSGDIVEIVAVKGGTFKLNNGRYLNRFALVSGYVPVVMGDGSNLL
ncbi:hypothetical protein Deipe_1167 [Deinococcus peraridilitoris DSM 19664]|uniref:Uncharacterized protein n=2 Tax=Deinococcus TaxID=1298 RepID=K9ZZU9_DEIPD|nr:hypothetical protein Deipe_1167 [Deinococcus peraridilitoris DSM 19664]